VAKRLAWSKAQCTRPSEARGVFDHVVINADDQGQVGCLAVERCAGRLAEPMQDCPARNREAAHLMSLMDLVQDG
jgi:hypothetical protein